MRICSSNLVGLFVSYCCSHFSIEKGESSQTELSSARASTDLVSGGPSSPITRGSATVPPGIYQAMEGNQNLRSDTSNSFFIKTVAFHLNKESTNRAKERILIYVIKHIKELTK